MRRTTRGRRPLLVVGALLAAAGGLPGCVGSRPQPAGTDPRDVAEARRDASAPSDGGCQAEAGPSDAAGPDVRTPGDVPRAPRGGRDARPDVRRPTDASAPPRDVPGRVDARDVPEGADVRADVAEPGPGCRAGRPDCTCVHEPRDEAGACWHSFGGRYADGACSGSYQCCGGRWRQGLEACGACRCTERTGREGCVPPEWGDEVCFPAFFGVAAPLPAAVREEMTGVSWRPDCPVGLDALVLLSVTHWGFDGEVYAGELVVAAEVADEVLAVLRHLYRVRFPIARMRRVVAYDASDDRSMADDNTSAFNCRPITGGGGWSEHSYGTAIDINPVENPYVRGDLVLPPAGEAFVDRADVQPGMVVDPGPVTGAFRARGWTWGGDWRSPKDYQHFSKSGR